MAAPSVPIDVDPETGVWSTEGVPMIYVPRHFFVNNHRAVEEALGAETYARQLFAAGFRSAYDWCEVVAKNEGLSGAEVFRHYMKRLSQRGWGRFTVQALDPDHGTAEVRVEHSVFVQEHRGGPARVCYMFAGWFPGSLSWVRGRSGAEGELESREAQCAAEGHAHCLFRVTPARG